jgi:beta-lactamase superfamily II metal-dependent hydrolase
MPIYKNCEIEFLPVGDGSKPGDAIVIRYGDVNAYALMVVDGGNLDSGAAVVEHIRAEFGTNSVISHVVITHPDGDHASGVREILDGLPVKNLWLHVPWASATAARPYFLDKRWTDAGLTEAIRKEYDLLGEIVATALERKIKVYEPFAGDSVGPFHVLSPVKGIYPLLLPQFDRTPDADQAALEATRFWIGKEPGMMARALDKAVAKIQKWTTESWDRELLKDGGVTSATNESSVILYGDCEGSGRVLLTGDAGVWALSLAAAYARQKGLILQDFKFVQVPHHGSRRNVGPTILNDFLGPIQPEGSPTRFSAFVSAPKDDDTHPRKMVLNAFLRRGAKVLATQGAKKVYFGGFPIRPNYSFIAKGVPFTSRVEDYD